MLAQFDIHTQKKTRIFPKIPKSIIFDIPNDKKQQIAWKLKNVASGKAAGKCYYPILLIFLTVLGLAFQKTHFFTLEIQDGRRNYGKMGHFDIYIFCFFYP